ncbi:MAG TPA: type I phosphomannose isomerase catalytic subunit [Symbiobacteriaceae bacterium]|nr:type I phosphomannose isomerase catalytic subunit [Symbiobacteriaceae bacterium]
MTQLYPLVLQPVFKERIWGGRKLEPFYGSTLPAGAIGEAWVLGEHDQGTSVVQNGPLAGKSLSELRQAFGAELLGARGMASPSGRCPLLIKLLDAQDDLSVQVHPADGYAGLPPGELGKTEMWYILAAEPGARIVYGLRDGVDAAAFAAAVANGRTLETLRYIPVQAGDVFYVPAGTIHALGRGTVVAEVQQSSDTVYRVYDYGRTGLDGKPRELHVEHALRVTRCDTPARPFRPAAPEPNQWQTLVESEFFAVARAECRGAWAQATASDSCDALLVLSGDGAVVWGTGEREILGTGAALLVPAGLGAYEITGNMTLLRSRV